MRKTGRVLLALATTVWLAGCTAMMIGGGNSGGYQPPEDQCEDGETGCRSK